MPLNDTQKKMLSGKLDPQYVKPAPAGKYGSYVEGWHVIAEANRIFGFDAWDSRTDLEFLSEYENDGKWRVSYMAVCTITVHADGDAITRQGSGFGQGIDRDKGMAHESALKEAETDARKRALMTFGNPFGLALYDKTQSMVGVPEPSDEAKKFVTAINGHKEREALETWGSTWADDIKAMDDTDQRHVRSAYASKLRALTPKQEAS